MEAQNILGDLEALVSRGIQPNRVDIVQSLVAASRIKTSTIGTREKLIRSAQVLLAEHASLQLQVEVVQQRSILMRLKGDINGSVRIIEEFLPRVPPAHTDVLGALYISQAKNFAYKFSFTEAHREAKKYAPIRIEGQPGLLWDHIHCVGRILRGQGRFEEARRCFELCLKTPELTESRRLVILSTTADLYCELDYQNRQLCMETAEPRSKPLLHLAKNWLTTELQGLQSRGPSKGNRRVLLSLAEIEIRLGCNDNARQYVGQVLGMFNSLTAPDIVDRLGHVRALVAAARVSSLEGAENLWIGALFWNRLYNPSEAEVFTCGVIYMYMCLVRHKLGDNGRSREYLEHAQEVFRTRERQFLIPGVGTYLVDFVVNEIHTLTGWNCRV
ncbi:hypothetical protein B0H66DRAFT_399869 [Apodospora peruviana]|uniref:Uncharacterized protein n=1 Tax=Apodospora peruviana TaxID=516989 RepID=A0AAE0LYM1_9PEZI|nr:hypothetical protein B0H66DRAFT_399869 [Apodospora peruviana]